MMRGRFSPLLKSWIAWAVLYAESGYQTWPAWGWIACNEGEQEWREWVESVEFKEGENKINEDEECTLVRRK